MKIHTGIALFASWLFCLVLTGCGSVLSSDKPAVTTWWLEPLATGTVAGDRGSRELSLQIEVVPGLDTERILTLDSHGQLNHYAGARWADNLPDVLGSVLSRSIGTTGRYASVTQRRSADDCHLRLEIGKFYAVLDRTGGTQSVQIALDGSLDCGSGLRSIHVQEAVAASGGSMSGIVAAFQQCLNRVTSSLIAKLDGD